MEILAAALPLVDCANTPGWKASTSSALAARPRSTCSLSTSAVLPATVCKACSACACSGLRSALIVTACNVCTCASVSASVGCACAGSCAEAAITQAIAEYSTARVFVDIVFSA